jgi:LETM1-like protein
MNPSANGWIKKLLKEVSLSNSFLEYPKEDFYNALRQSGFIYGSNVSIIKDFIKKKDFTPDEICKINLLLTLLHTHHNSDSTLSPISSIISFYSEIDMRKTSFFQGILKGKKSTAQLEKIITKRIQINDNIISKNFNYFVINALLFVDILAYKEYLKNHSISNSYIKQLEASIENISISVLNSKVNKTKYDNSLIALLESSLRYQNNANLNYKDAVQLINTTQEKHYILDIACMATWSDKTIDEDEQHFLYQLGKDFKLDRLVVEQSINTINRFYNSHKDDIALLSSKNIVETFYDNSSKMVSKLIFRNGRRLKKELKQSKELMVLITQSTIRDLSEDEQKKMQKQLLDIFKSIPSLAIFMLPGGTLLLPLFIKFIPKLLPSAFDDNRIEDEK